MTDPVVLGGRYELIEIIGRGGMAEVWRGNDTRLSRDVAIKRLRVDLASDETFQARFRREAQSAAGLNHPNIVAVYDTGEEIDPSTQVALPYIVMELVEGHTLREILRDGRKILPERALEFTAGVLDALNYSHRAGIIHRDIKPGNVMITRGNVVKVMDFGIARAVADTSATMTQTAAVIGTAQYLSPEQARGEMVDNRSDIYSTGCLLYELLTGRPPFQGDSPVSVAYQHVRENPTPPSQLDPEVTPEMDAIVLKSLAKDPSERYQTAREMRDDILRLLAGEEITAMVPPAVAAPTPQPTSEDAVATSEVTSALAPRVPTTRTVTPSARSASSPEPVEDPDAALATETEPRKRRLTTGTWVLIGLLAALLIAAGFVLLRLSQSGQPDTSPVPNVHGSTEAQARATLENLGFRLGRVTRTNGPGDVTVNTVIDQDPPAQTRHAPGTEVNITINIGPKQGTIPDVRGQAKDAAIKILNDNGFLQVTAVPADPKDEPLNAEEGTVISMDPKPNETGSPDTPIELTIATGTSPLPNLVGATLTEAEARKQLEDAGFTLRDYKQENGPDDQTKGTITSQTPPSGDPPLNVKRGAQVDVVVNVGPKTAKLPANLRGMSTDDAIKALKAAGFTGQVKTVESNNLDEEPANFKKGDVLSVTPSDSQLPADTAFTLTVAKGLAKVPNFSDTTFQEAQKMATDAGFTVPLKQQVVANDTVAKGLVFEQDPSRDTVADKTIAITVTVSGGPTSGGPSATSSRTP